MRYEVRWSNGSWKTFDTFEYRAVGAHGREADAKRHSEDANASVVRR